MTGTSHALNFRTKKQMKSIARQLVGSHLAHQTAEAATQQRQSERVSNMGSAGDSPAPVGDSPTGTAPSHVANRPFALPRTVVSVPSGGSPVLPETIFQSRSQAKWRGLSSVAEWIEQIQTLWANGAESRLELASLISTIRNHLRQRRGDWSSLWESGEIPFSKRKAEKLVVVGDGLGWAVNANACSHLPTEWNALYYIAKLRRSIQKTCQSSLLTLKTCQSSLLTLERFFSILGSYAAQAASGV